MIRQIPAVTNIFVAPDASPTERIATQQPFKINERKKFQRPAKKSPHTQEVYSVQKDNKKDKDVAAEIKTPKGVTTRHQLNNISHPAN